MKRSQQTLMAATLVLVLSAGILGGCGSKNNSGSSSDKVTIDFTYWASSEGEQKAFDDLKAEFEAKYPNITINMQMKPSSDEFHPQLENQIAANQAPDVFRVQYQQLGRYIGADVLLDLTPYLSQELIDQIQPAFLKAVTVDGKIVAVPHHTDTLAIYYNADYLEQIGVEPPTSLEDAWTWDEFIEVAQKLKDAGLCKYPVTFNWAARSAYRWLPFLYQNGGQLLNDDFTKAQINTPEGIEALAWTQNLFQNYMSPGNSLKGTDKSQELFATGVSGLMINGDWMIPYFDTNMKNYRWGVTYMPVNKTAGTDMGGNALVVPKNAKHPEEAALFVAFVMEKEMNKMFVEEGYFLPVRKDLDVKDLTYDPHPDLMAKFVEQVTVLSPHAAQTMVMPEFPQLNQILADALEAMLVEGVSPEQTAADIEAKINQALQ